MPQASLWVQYSLIGILALCIAGMSAAFYRFWRDLLKWMDKQNQERASERDKQREWEAAQKKESDLRWQIFLEKQQVQWLAQDLNHSAVLLKLVDKTDYLISAVNNHDTWVRAHDGK
jgi:hypothetical protein